jgi:hypothetical protein
MRCDDSAAANRTCVMHMTASITRAVRLERSSPSSAVGRAGRHHRATDLQVCASRSTWTRAPIRAFLKAAAESRRRIAPTPADSRRTRRAQNDALALLGQNDGTTTADHALWMVARCRTRVLALHSERPIRDSPCCIGLRTGVEPHGRPTSLYPAERRSPTSWRQECQIALKTVLPANLRLDLGKRFIFLVDERKSQLAVRLLSSYWSLREPQCRHLADNIRT